MLKQDVIDLMDRLRSSIREVESVKQTMLTTVSMVNKKLDEAYKPVNLEHDILSSVQASIHDAIKNSLSGYNSPMQKLVLKVVSNHESELLKIINDAFSTVIKTDEFKKAILDGFSHKVARTIISNNDGLFDKVSNDLKQDQTFKAKMTLAVANVVNECLEERKQSNQ